MVKSYPALTTLIRGRLGRNLTEAYQFFNEKSINLSVEDEDLYSLVAERDGHGSELTDLCHNGLIYRDNELVCYKGPKIQEMTLSEAQENESIVWNEKTVFTEKVDGKKIFMYWDPKKEDWGFADYDKPINNSYGKVLREKLVNIYNLEYYYTLVFILSQDDKRHKNGIYLETMYDNKKGFEIEWPRVWNYATRLGALPVQYYYFEGFEKLEPEDFPIYVLDISKNRVLLTGM